MSAEPILGGVYADAGTDGGYRVCKVIAFDEDTVHVTQYSNHYAVEPIGIPPDLTLLGTSIATVGMEHMPIDRKEFAGEQHTLLGVETVRDHELGGYHKWLGLGDEDDEEPARD